MKRYTFGIIASLGILAIGLLSGCSTTSSFQPSTPQTQALTQAAVETGASTATVLILDKNPTYASDFAAGATVLDNLSGSTNALTPGQIDSALSQAGSTNPVVNALISSDVTTLLSAYESSNTNAPVNNAQVDQYLQWIATGINNGLAASTPAK